ncbi:MAG: hypothetical protein KGR26_16795 [Cyanobacteria bacterium REEB65]|nr:hypothetical protein [Cyanobacteria bacterium REEB65]
MIPTLAFVMALSSSHRNVRHLAARPLVHRHPHPVRTAPPVRMDEIGIIGQSTVYDGLAHTYTVAGKVKVALKDMTVTCDRAILDTSPDEDQVIKILFSGNVVAVREHNTFRGDQVTYYVSTKRLVAEGDTRTRVLLPQSGASGLPRALGTNATEDPR